MGWDCYAANFRLVDLHNDKHRIEIINPEHRRLFKNASNYVKRKAKSADWLLEHGGLDCFDCAEMLQKATGMDCWGNNLTKKQVREFAKNANWVFSYDHSLDWAYWSARKFLETAAKCNLTIRFSW